MGCMRQACGVCAEQVEVQAYRGVTVQSREGVQSTGEGREEVPGAGCRVIDTG